MPIVAIALSPPQRTPHAPVQTSDRHGGQPAGRQSRRRRLSAEQRAAPRSRSRCRDDVARRLARAAARCARRPRSFRDSSAPRRLPPVPSRWSRSRLPCADAADPMRADDHRHVVLARQDGGVAEPAADLADEAAGAAEIRQPVGIDHRRDDDVAVREFAGQAFRARRRFRRRHGRGPRSRGSPRRACREWRRPGRLRRRSRRRTRPRSSRPSASRRATLPGSGAPPPGDAARRARAAPRCRGREPSRSRRR